MSGNLFQAILAMDAYNRGYSPKIDRLGDLGTKLGNATIVNDSRVLLDASKERLDAPAGFYAVAYQIGTSKVISYRGTDALAAWPWDDKNGSDIWNGWGVGAGSPQGRQAALAFQFYKTIAGAGVDPRTANISLTGHSLGGGLAGLVGNIYGKSATMFDNMAFELAAKNTYEHSYYTLRTTYSPNLRARVYGTLSPWAPVNSYLISYYTRGEVLTNLRNFQLTAQIEVGAGLSFGSLSATDLHDMALLVIDMFGDSVVGDWKKSSYHLMPALFNNAVASAAGVGALPGTLNEAKDWSSILRQIVAYSAIDSGTTVFGDAAIRVMYDDANDLGGALSLVAPSAALKANGAALANTLVQFAGQVALAKAMRAGHAEALNGVLNLDGAKSRLVIDFSKNIWTLNGAIAQTNIVGRQELTEAILSSEDPSRTSGKGLGAAAFAESIGKIVLATTNVGQTITVPVATDAGKSLMYVAGDGNDKLTGSTISDLIYGGLGDDTFYASAGNDVLTGGAGTNTVNYSTLSAGITVNAGATALTYTITKPSGTDTVSAEKIVGTSVTDVFYASSKGNDYFTGGAGQDRFYGGDGSDTLQGGLDSDSISYNLHTSGVTIRATGAFNYTVAKASGTDTVESVEWVVGTRYNDSFYVGSNGNDNFYGNGGNDYFYMGGGNTATAFIYTTFGVVRDTVYGYHAGESVVIDGTRLSGAMQGKDGIYRSGSWILTPGNGGVIVTTANGSTVVVQTGSLWNETQDAITYGGTGGVTLTKYKDANGNPTDAAGNPWWGGWAGVPGRIFGWMAGADNSLWATTFRNTSFSPIILDLNGNGVETLGRNSGVFFDHDKNGFAEQTGWVGGNDGLLVWDRNGNGLIDNGGELFGNNALNQNSTVAGNGFEILASYDANHDGRIDAADALWSKLKLWVDGNHNGITDAGELKTLASYNVKSLATDAVNAPGATDAAGNHPLFTGSYTKTDGTVAAMADVFFAADTASTIPNAWMATTAAIDALPDIGGQGTVYSLHQAMARDASGTLKTLVTQFTTQTTIAARKATLEQILQYWTGSQNIAVNSRNRSGATIDARQLAALEAFVGAHYVNKDYVSGYGAPDDPTGFAAEQLNTDYYFLSERIYAELAAQSFLKPFYDRINTITDANGTRFDFGAALTALFASTHDNIVEFYRTVFASGLLSEQVNYASLRAALAANKPSYVAEVDALLQPYYNTSAFFPDKDGSRFTGTLGDNTFYGKSDSYGKPVTSPNVIYGNAGNDTLMASDMGDTIYGGDGNDTLVGGNGIDKLYGGAGDDTVQEFYDSNPTQSDIIDGGAGNNTLLASNLDISHITIRNMQGLNVYSGTISLTLAQLNGFTALQGYGTLQAVDSGVYSLVGKTITGNINLSGSAGNDTLTGAATTSYIGGNDGNDILNAGSGGTTMEGGAGDDTLYGGVGNDTLDGGAGIDKIYGGAGNDTIMLSRDAAAGDVIDGGAGANTLNTRNIYGYTNCNISLAAISNTQTLDAYRGTVFLTAAQLNGFTTLQGSSTLQAVGAGVYSLAGKTVTGSFDLSGSAGNDTLTGAATTTYIAGNDGNDILNAGSGGTTMDGGAGDDTLYGGVGNDTLDGGAGIDNIYGGAGDDIIQVSGDAVAGDVIDGGAGTNTLTRSRYASYSPDISLTKISNVQMLDPYWGTISLTAAQLNGFTTILSYGTLQAVGAGVYSLAGKTVSGAINLQGSAGNDTLTGAASTGLINGNDGNDVLTAGVNGTALYGGNGNDTLYGGAGADTITGGDGIDMLDGKWGADTLYGEAGDDNYVFGRGYGADTITDYDSTVGNTDNITLGAGISRDQLWFTHSGNDLIMQLIGTSDKLTVKDWYGGVANHVEKIRTIDGHILTDAKLQNLVNAMAALTPPATTTLSTTYHSTLDPVIAANWT